MFHTSLACWACSLLARDHSPAKFGIAAHGCAFPNAADALCLHASRLPAALHPHRYSLSPPAHRDSCTTPWLRYVISLFVCRASSIRVCDTPPICIHTRIRAIAIARIALQIRYFMFWTRFSVSQRRKCSSRTALFRSLDWSDGFMLGEYPGTLMSVHDGKGPM